MLVTGINLTTLYDGRSIVLVQCFSRSFIFLVLLLLLFLDLCFLFLYLCERDINITLT